jgi:hypothetical protein
MSSNVGKKIGCGIFGCVGSVFAFVGVILYFTLFSNSCARMLGEETYPLAGDASRFDPFAAIPDLRARLGADAELLEVDANFVRSDGTLDLKASYSPAPYADYKFRVPLKNEPKDAPPIGAGRKPGDVWVQDVDVRAYQPGQRRSVTRTSGNTRTSYTYTNEGFDFDRRTPQMETLGEGIPDPKLSVKELWQAAIEKGADGSAVARIEYDKDGYAFTIAVLKIFLYWNLDGEFDERRSRWPSKN